MVENYMLSGGYDGAECYVETFAKTHPGKVRSHNEDAILDMSQQGVWVVADGMGGHEAGNIASQMVVEAISKCVEETPASTLSIDHLREVLISVNQQVSQYASDNLDNKVMGSTVVVLLIQNSHFHCLWVGDSRMYLKRAGRLRQKTRDHSQVMELLEQGLIGLHEVENHPLSNVITRAVGVSDYLVIDQVSGQIAPGDTFLLCSDGVTDELNDTELLSCIGENSLSNIGLTLMQSVLSKGARDNVSCVLVKVCGHPQAREVLTDTLPVFLNQG
ncbi:protein phosphatase 2C domain-containing protein [Vibrio sp. SCSIO 43136]|uniref:PP2C family protein-serine/threonine phosphatase n=1 Tax=Vibrio sp. SCSIO 43136 TaxID=2819101 RepID=UPI0020760713|nr:protein phosphatase 2C domain-containing protein [Vibrio sp. SCSIO 43136]USD67509.1 serine/threonine-protein phosphatase [Vibrio sp. SCSIO 43136]